MTMPPKPEEICLPSQYLGMMGDGQLGRMFCHAAQAMGYKVVVLGTVENGPAAQVAEDFICANYEDEQALAQLSQKTKWVTTEFENVPGQSLKTLSMTGRVAPCAAAVAVAQDRIAEKGFIASQDIAVAPYAEIRSAQDITEVYKDLFPGILKIATLGYDGKGQANVDSPEQALQAFRDFKEVPCVLEAKLDLDYEVSIVLARGHDGEVKTFPMGVNNHINGILSSTVVLEDAISEKVKDQAVDYAKTIAAGLNYVGVLCVEFFVLKDCSIVVNEIAPRPHNSGHYTMNACQSSQFEQQVRALTSLPLAETSLQSPAIMLNVLGDSWFVGDSSEARTPAWDQVLALPGVALHLYSKAEPRKGRKMGHINIINKDVDALFKIAQQVSDILHLNAELKRYGR